MKAATSCLSDNNLRALLRFLSFLAADVFGEISIQFARQIPFPLLNGGIHHGIVGNDLTDRHGRTGKHAALFRPRTVPVASAQFIQMNAGAVRPFGDFGAIVLINSHAGAAACRTIAAGNVYRPGLRCLDEIAPMGQRRSAPFFAGYWISVTELFRFHS